MSGNTHAQRLLIHILDAYFKNQAHVGMILHPSERSLGPDGELERSMTVVAKKLEQERDPKVLSQFLQNIMDAAHEALAVIDEDMRILLANRYFHQLTENISDSGNPLWKISELRAKLDEVFSGESIPEPFEITLDVPGQGQRTLMLHLHRLPAAEKDVGLTLVAMADRTELVKIKERLQSEIEGCVLEKQELLDSGKNFRMLIETMNDGLAVRDELGVLSYANKRLCEILKRPRDEIIGHPVNYFLDEENRYIYESNIRKRQQGSQQPYELTWKDKDGNGVHTIMSPKPIYDSEGKIRGSFAIVTDITDRKRVEIALRTSERRLRMLSNHLLRAQEKEREYISRELHDELGQDLTVLKYQMRFIERRLGKDQRLLREACLDALHHIDDIVENIRRISRNLRPYNLEHLGLTESLQRIADDFSKHTGIKVFLETDNIDSLLSREAAISLYRICQEALTNIGKYSRATKVSISIKHEDGKLLCSLWDNGAGFNVAGAKSGLFRSGGMGLAAMEERAKMISGSLEIQSGKGSGTRVLLTIPTLRKVKSNGRLPYHTSRRSSVDSPGHQKDNRGKTGAGGNR